MNFKQNKKTSIILLSGGLDSVVSIVKSKTNVKLGLIFDYGQIAFKRELTSAKKIAKLYSFPLEVIKLDWLKNILSSKSLWIPNRNALFLNIAAAYCESKNIDCVIIGANKEEAKAFKDNSKEFIKSCNILFKNSTNSNVKVIAPLMDMNKKETVKYALENNIPLEMIYSCYKGKEKHCGECESCLHLKKALEDNSRGDLIKKLF